MKNIIMKKKSENIQYNVIHKFEDKYQFQIPKQMLEFYITHNGGVPKEYIYNDKERIFIINHFLPFTYALYGDMTVEEEYESLLEDGELIEGYVPFAIEEGGNYFLISLNEKDYGYVYIWYHEYIEDDKFEENIRKLSSSFEKF